jgi:hypothetical protein
MCQVVAASPNCQRLLDSSRHMLFGVNLFNGFFNYARLYELASGRWCGVPESLCAYHRVRAFADVLRTGPGRLAPLANQGYLTLRPATC